MAGRSFGPASGPVVLDFPDFSLIAWKKMVDIKLDPELGRCWLGCRERNGGYLEAKLAFTRIISWFLMLHARVFPESRNRTVVIFDAYRARQSLSSSCHGNAAVLGLFQ